MNIYPPYYCPPHHYTYPPLPESRTPAQWVTTPVFAPQPWKCPRCKKMHGPQSLSCDCKPE
jgi:hypothetical protein